MFAWLAYLEAIGASEISGMEAEVESLNTPLPKGEAAENAARMKRVRQIRDHIAAVRLLAFPPDEPEDLARG